MNYLTHQFLNNEEINLIKKELDKYTQDWEDGRKTAGTYASKVKNNIQLSRESEVSKKFTKFIIEKLNKDQLIKSFSLSKKIHGTIFTKSI